MLFHGICYAWHSTPPSHIQIQEPLKLLQRIGTWQIPTLLSRLRSRIIFCWTLSWISSLPPLCKSDCSFSHRSLYHPQSNHCIFSNTLRPQLDYRFVCSYWTASSLDKKFVLCSSLYPQQFRIVTQQMSVEYLFGILSDTQLSEMVCPGLESN